MPPILTSSQRAANALRRAEKALRNWQDEPKSPRADVDKMLIIVADLRAWVQGHVIADIEHVDSTRPIMPLDRSNVIPHDLLIREPVDLPYPQ